MILYQRIKTKEYLMAESYVALFGKTLVNRKSAIPRDKQVVKIGLVEDLRNDKRYKSIIKELEK